MSTHDTITYEQFGQRFVELVVSTERVANTIAAIAGDQIDLGQLRAGPGDTATVTGRGRIALPAVEATRSGEWLSFHATLPVSLELKVVVAGAAHRYTAQLEIPLQLTVRTAAPLDLVIDIAEPDAGDIRVDLQADGLRAKVLRKAGNIDHEVRRHAARFVGERLRDHTEAGAKVIELLPLVDDAWDPTA